MFKVYNMALEILNDVFKLRKLCHVESFKSFVKRPVYSIFNGTGTEHLGSSTK